MDLRKRDRSLEDLQADKGSPNPIDKQKTKNDTTPETFKKKNKEPTKNSSYMPHATSPVRSRHLMTLPGIRGTHVSSNGNSALHLQHQSYGWTCLPDPPTSFLSIPTNSLTLPSNAWAAQILNTRARSNKKQCPFFQLTLPPTNLHLLLPSSTPGLVQPNPSG
jgi:hypothetical protein